MSYESNGLVVWSGGCDSTLVLHDLATKSSSIKPVRAVAFRVPGHVSADREQSKARKRILKEFKKRGFHVQYNEIVIDVAVGGGLDSHGLPQAAVWAIATQMLKKEEDLYFGYVKGDCWVYYREDFMRMFDAWQRLSDRTGRFRAPLAQIPKQLVIDRLEAAKILQLTWWCSEAAEGAKGLNKGKLRMKPCGDCNSCRAHETALMIRKRWKAKK